MLEMRVYYCQSKRAGGFFTTRTTWEATNKIHSLVKQISIARMMIQGTATPMLNRRVHIKQREEHCVLT